MNEKRPTKPRIKRTKPHAQQPEVKPKCHIHDDVSNLFAKDIRKNVCVNDEEFTEYEGKHYCLFHLPTKEKDVEKFNKIFQQRLEDIEEEIKSIETELAEAEREEESKIIDNFRYDFRYAWFPSEVDLSHYKFNSSVSFSRATFNSSAKFNSATFTGITDFTWATFNSRADFRSTIFTSEYASFMAATFNSQTAFISATFNSWADFSWTIFNSFASFNSATFTSDTHFNSAEFRSSVSFSESTFTLETIFSSATFTLAADFSLAKFNSTTEFISAKFNSSADFSLAIFTSDTNFSSVVFSSDTNFSLTTFNSSADFSGTTFTSNTNFSSATFTSFAYFSSATFLETSQTFFYQTSFQSVVDFVQAVVKGYLYFEAGKREFLGFPLFDVGKKHPKKFNGVEIPPAKFMNYFDIRKEYLSNVNRSISVFEGSLAFAQVRAEKPERITFNKVRLCASWFVNTDSRKFVFTDIEWENHRGSKAELKGELTDLKKRGFAEPHNFQLLTIAFRNLAANAEEFNRFEEASKFRKSASECERLERLNRRKPWWSDLGERWKKNILCWELFIETKKALSESWRLLRKAPFDFVHFLYRWLSGYGEKWFRAFVWLLVIWLGFAFLYYFVQGFEGNAQIGFSDSLGYSLQVMTLQRPEPRPAGFTRVIYGIETILAPLQAALLALAIRRKFMR